jgi:Transposase IS116/IS110/IS902 family
MASGRAADWENPTDSRRNSARHLDWDPIRELHLLGQTTRRHRMYQDWVCKRTNERVAQMDVKRISIDTPKHTFTLHGVDLQERPILQREIRRAQLEPFFAKLELTVDPGNFQSGRHLAAWLGLPPRKHSTAGQHRLGKISKAGNERLRQLLVVGAMAVIRVA